jgi:hypothetical protein
MPSNGPCLGPNFSLNLDCCGVQERYIGQAGQGRNSGPASSAESHPGSSTADLSHVAPFQSAPVSTLQENEKPAAAAGRGGRQRKRKEPEITDERTMRQHKRMVRLPNLGAPVLAMSVTGRGCCGGAVQVPVDIKSILQY